MFGLRVLTVALAIAFMITGCGRSASLDSQAMARVKMASFSGDGLSFRYPAAWTARRWPLFMISDERTIAYLTQAQLHDPCKRAKNAYGGVGVSCRGGVLNALPVGDVFITWALLGDGPEPAAGEHLVIDQHRATVSYNDAHICGEIRGVERGIAAAIATGTGNWYEMEACLRGPGLPQAEAEVRVMLQTVRLHDTG
jgi:hypothetical protein